MKYISLIVDEQIVAQIPTKMDSEECIDLDEMLRQNGIYGDNTEVAITYDV